MYDGKGHINGQITLLKTWACYNKFHWNHRRENLKSRTWADDTDKRKMITRYVHGTILNVVTQVETAQLQQQNKIYDSPQREMSLPIWILKWDRANAAYRNEMHSNKYKHSNFSTKWPTKSNTSILQILRHGSQNYYITTTSSWLQLNEKFLVQSNIKVFQLIHGLIKSKSLLNMHHEEKNHSNECMLVYGSYQ